MVQPEKENPIRAALIMIAASDLIGMTTILAEFQGLGLEGKTLHPLQFRRPILLYLGDLASCPGHQTSKV